MPDPGRAFEPGAGICANTVPAGRDSAGGGAVVTTLTLKPAAWASLTACVCVIPVMSGTALVASCAGGVPLMAWHGDIGDGDVVGKNPGSIGDAVLVG